MFRLATGLNTEHLISIRIIQLAASADGGWRLEFFNLNIDVNVYTVSGEDIPFSLWEGSAFSEFMNLLTHYYKHAF